MKASGIAILAGLLTAATAMGQANQKANRPARVDKQTRVNERAMLRPRPKLVLPEGVRYIGDIEYAQFENGGNFLDLYIQEKSAQPTPAVVWIHGDLWSGGDKLDVPSTALLVQGLALISIDYRDAGDAIFPAQLHDCKGAIRWVRAHAKEYNIDSQRIGVWGTSGGGHLAALVGTTGDVSELEGTVGGNLAYSSRVQAVAVYAAPTDLVRLGAAHTSPKAPEAVLLGGPVPLNKDKAAAASPVSYLTRDDPPFLVMHGQNDDIVPISQSEMFAAALKSAGIGVDYVAVPGTHQLRGRQVMQNVQDFFGAHLRPPGGK